MCAYVYVCLYMLLRKRGCEFKSDSRSHLKCISIVAVNCLLSSVLMAVIVRVYFSFCHTHFIYIFLWISILYFNLNSFYFIYFKSKLFEIVEKFDFCCSHKIYFYHYFKNVINKIVVVVIMVLNLLHIF